MPRKSAAELKKQRRADRWGVGSADTPPVEGAPTPSELVAQWVQTHATDKAPDGVAWGAHVKRWRSDGAQDTHISAIIAATSLPSVAIPLTETRVSPTCSLPLRAAMEPLSIDSITL